MNNPLKIIILIILILALILVAGYFYNMDNNPANPINTGNNSQLLRECPDEMIVNRMPGTSPQSSYYIVDGERREIDEYDSTWVEQNCNVPTQEVF